MGRIPTLQGLMSPAHTLLMLIIFCGVGLVVSVILLIAKLMSPKLPSAPAGSTISEEELDRRRRLLELERMELEVQERKRRMAA